MKKPKKEFNGIITGIGGQGQITLLKILSEAAFLQDYDVKTSELHGLSQRGGTVEAHFRFGKKIFSPLVKQGGADFVLSLELQESLRVLYYTNSETKILLNDYLRPIPGQNVLSKKDILSQIKKFSKKIQLIPANEICKKELGKEILSGVYLISFAVHQNLIPLKADSLLAAIKKNIPEKYLELNLGAFNFARQSFSSKKLGG